MTIKPYTPVQLAEDAKNFPPVSSQHKPNLDKTFLRQLRAILRICFPSWHSKETLILVLHSFFLVARTVLSVGVARLDGRIVRDLVSADGKGFLKGLGLWFALAIPSTYTNTMVSVSVGVVISCSLSPSLDSSFASQALFTVKDASKPLHKRPVPLFRA